MRKWACIQLIDKCLLIIMLILMIQSMVTLFIKLDVGNESRNIDVVVRTTIASIFGYFISANFIRNEQNAPVDCDIGKKRSMKLRAGKTVKRVRSVKLSWKEAQNITHQTTPSATSLPNRLQIIIVTGLCLCALAILLALRNITGISMDQVPMVAQLRDIICGSVGFLIGSPGSNDQS